MPIFLAILPLTGIASTPSEQILPFPQLSLEPSPSTAPFKTFCHTEVDFGATPITFSCATAMAITHLHVIHAALADANPAMISGA